jgi:hypothetical protein
VPPDRAESHRTPGHRKATDSRPCHHGRVSVEFEPVKLGPRRRRVDPVAIAALIVAIGLVAAVLKPWNAGAAAGSAAGSAAAPSGFDSLSGPRATALPPPSRPVTASTASLASWDDVRTVVRPHDAWGIRTIVAVPSLGLAPTRQRFAEVWDAIPDPDGSRGSPTVDIEPNDQTVVAIGITFPASHTPLDARIWLVHPDRLEWVDAKAMAPDPSGGAFLYQLVTGSDSVQNWGAGRYRIDVLVDGAVRRFGFTLPNRFEIVPDRPEPPAVAGPLIDPRGGALPDLPTGLFVTVAGVSIPLPADEGPPLDEAAEWLNVDRHPGTDRPPRSFVAAVFLPATTGLGVTLPAGSVVQDSVVHRLAPAPLPSDPELVVDPNASAPPTAGVLYRASGGGAWPPGVYEISVVWAEADVVHDWSWHLELRPGPVRQGPALLAAARGWARFAGSTGVILGTPEPLDREPGADAIRLLRLRPAAGPAYPAASGVGCGTTTIDGLPGILGFTYPADRYASTARATILFPFPRGGLQPVMTAAFGVPGLILVAPASSPTLATAGYRFTVGEAAHATTYSVCLGETQSND